VEKELERYHNYPYQRISLQIAEEVIGMEESPVAALKRKRNSSIQVAVNLIKEGRAEALVSAGNTGAVVAITTLHLGLLPGVERAGIAIVIPTLKDPCLIIDVGANINPRPLHLFQYAIMAKVYAEQILQREKPRIGLLNIGEEESKGTNFVKETFSFFKSRNGNLLNFIGYIEGRDIFAGEVDCVVCDGFVGNIVLKVAESLGETITEMLRRELSRNIFSKSVSLLLKNRLKNLKKNLDYSEYGGAPLLGTQKICIIAHGASSAKAIKNAIRVAKEFGGHRINNNIVEALKKC